MAGSDTRVALTIAGSDSSGGAGIQADLKTFAALGVYGTTAITAITAQSTIGVVDAAVLSADLVTAQIEAVAGDIDIHAVKTGMLGDAAVVEAVAAAIKELDLPLLVVDPVLAASGGARLLDDEGLAMLCDELLPLAHVVTPNVPEAEVLSGTRIQSDEDLREAARRIHDRGARGVIITGGHHARYSHEVVDTLFDGRHFSQFRAPRIDSPNTHGTGCTFAAAVAAHLALGRPLVEAAELAQKYVAGAIEHSISIGRGSGPLGHFWER
ncbi:MAG TPA: bifunctional hydroxymethylpyrimidine kinase/phosphomethylpyrimidine kinase [Vicinamibacterales bacterium]|nr:bifunctional hydroxymethylpyrimidine kinase/phosphomethylpyrimidine kinase [Vicinamibacterales bacterium]